MRALSVLPLLAAALAALPLVAGCASGPRRVPILASAVVAPDFDAYRLRRVGLLPFDGEVAAEHRDRVVAAFHDAISRATPYEVVVLGEPDLELVRRSDPFRQGWYAPETILELARRHRLDALFFGAVARHQTFPPQKLSVQLDLVAVETGLVVWSGTVHLDAADAVVREALERYHRPPTHDDPQAEDWHVTLLSPARFTEFAAFQIASLL